MKENASAGETDEEVIPRLPTPPPPKNFKKYFLQFIVKNFCSGDCFSKSNLYS